MIRDQAEYLRAGLTAPALTKAQRRELKKLLGTDALVERVAEAVALHNKTKKLLVRDPGAVRITMRDFSELHDALTTARRVLLKMHESTDGQLFGSGANYFFRRLKNSIVGGRRLTSPFSLEQTEVALLFLEDAVNFIVLGHKVNRGGRPRKRGEFLFSLVEEIARDSGKRSAKALPGVLRIALEAIGEDAEECDRLLDRIKRGRSPDRRTNRSKT